MAGGRYRVWIVGPIAALVVGCAPSAGQDASIGTEPRVVEMTVTVRSPLIVGLDAATPAIKIMSPVANPCGTGVVTTEGFAAVFDVIGMTR